MRRRREFRDRRLVGVDEFERVRNDLLRPEAARRHHADIYGSTDHVDAGVQRDPRRRLVGVGQGDLPAPALEVEREGHLARLFGQRTETLVRIRTDAELVRDAGHQRRDVACELRRVAGQFLVRGVHRVPENRVHAGVQRGRPAEDCRGALHPHLHVQRRRRQQRHRCRGGSDCGRGGRCRRGGGVNRVGSCRRPGHGGNCDETDDGSAGCDEGVLHVVHGKYAPHGVHRHGCHSSRMNVLLARSEGLEPPTF